MYRFLRGGWQVYEKSEDILKFLEVKPEMTIREVAKLFFGKPVEYKKGHSSINRSLHALEKYRPVKRVQIQPRWKSAEQQFAR